MYWGLAECAVLLCNYETTHIPPAKAAKDDGAIPGMFFRVFFVDGSGGLVPTALCPYFRVCGRKMGSIEPFIGTTEAKIGYAQLL